MSIRIDNTADRIYRTTNLPGTSSFSSLCWMYFISPLLDGQSLFYYGINSDPDLGQYYQLGMPSGATGVISMFNGVSGVDGSALSASTWYHIAIVDNGTSGSNLFVYLNGVLDITQTATSVPINDILEIGNDRFSERCDARLMGWKVYSAALTAAEIQQEMRQIAPVRTANLNGWYPLLTAGMLEDYSGAGNNLTSAGTLTTEDPPPVPWSSLGVPRIYIPSVAGPSEVRLERGIRGLNRGLVRGAF